MPELFVVRSAAWQISHAYITKRSHSNELNSVLWFSSNRYLCVAFIISVQERLFKFFCIERIAFGANERCWTWEVDLWYCITDWNLFTCISGMRCFVCFSNITECVKTSVKLQLHWLTKQLFAASWNQLAFEQCIVYNWKFNSVKAEALKTDMFVVVNK